MEYFIYLDRSIWLKLDNEKYIWVWSTFDPNIVGEIDCIDDRLLSESSPISELEVKKHKLEAL